MKQRAKRFSDNFKKRGDAGRPGKKCKKCKGSGFLKNSSAIAFGFGSFPCPCRFK